MDKEDKTTVIIKTNLYKLLSFVTHNLIRVTFVIWLVLDPCLLKAGDLPAAVCFCNSVFVRTSTSPVALAKAVAADLLGMSTDCTTAGKAKSAEWAIPCGYQRGLTEIHYVPYENIGMVTGYGILRLYLPWILVIFILLLVIVIFSVYTVRMKIRFKQVTPLRCEQAMRESETKLREAQEMAHLGYWYWDIKTGEVEWSEEIYKIFRQDSMKFIPQIDSIINLFSLEEDSQRNKEFIARAMKNHEQGNFVQKILRPDGSTGYCFSTFRGIYDNNDNLIAMKGTVQDITEKKMVEVTILENEQKFRSIYESSRDAIVILDEDSFLDCNVAALQLFGYTSKETFCRYHPADVSPAFQPDGRSSRQKADDMIMAAIQGRSEIFEWIYQRKDGSDFPTEILLSPIKWEGKEAILAVVRDITDRKRAEEVLRESEAKLREAQEMAHLGYWYWDIKTGEVEWSEEIYKIFHQDPKEFIPQIDSIMKLSPWEEDSQRNKVLMARAMEDHEQGNFEQKFLRPDGSIGYYFSTYRGIYDNNDNLIAMKGTVQDITEKKMVEVTILENEQKFRSIYESSRDAIVILDENSFLDCNVAALQMFGYASKETFCRYHPADVSPAFQPDGRSSRQKADDMIMAAIQGRSEIFEWIYQRKDGSDFPTEILLSPIKWEGKEAILAVVRDITDRKRAEEVLRESEAKYRIMFSMAQAGIMITTVENGEIIECNTRLANIFGYDSVEQCKAEFVIEDHYVDTQQRKVLVEALKKNGEIRDFEIRITRRDGVEIWAIVSSALYPSKEIIGSVIVDVTEQKQTQLMIEKSLAEKEILLRELYHRTKNNMQVIIAMLELQTEYTENKHIDEIFTDIKNRIKAMSMVHQHLYQAENLSKINLKQYVDDLVEKLIKSFHLPEDKIKYRPSMSDVWVLIDFAMPFGLILNELITNSCKHAFPDKQKGEIVIKLNRTNSNNIYLLVSDNGIGPPPGFDLKIHSKLGLHNVVSLVKYQLYGKVTFNFENGFLCEIEFKDDIYRERV